MAVGGMKSVILKNDTLIYDISCFYKKTYHKKSYQIFKAF